MAPTARFFGPVDASSATLFRCLIAMTLALGACGCQRSDDQAKTSSALAAPAQRVVSLSPALTEVLFAVGCGDALVARDGWSDFPAAALRAPKLTGLVPSVEAIVTAKPDRVLTHFPPKQLQTGLAAAGIPWTGLAPERLDDIGRTIETIGDLCGQPARAQQLHTHWNQEVQAIRQLKPVGTKVYVELDAGRGRPHTVGRGTFVDDVIVAAGGINVMANGGSWFQVSTEQVLAARPALIVLSCPREFHATRIAELKARPGWDQLPAVKNDRVFAIEADLFSRPGPRLLLGLRQLAALIHRTQPPPLPTQIRDAIAPQ
ncbi:MAG: ABC transporter substrate-binding protein [Myxococcales bacterium]|nr:ABC transporter substrate-binding protein [Myxococcales bacterium]